MSNVLIAKMEVKKDKDTSMVGQYPNYNYRKNSRPKCIALILDYWNHIKFRT